jgi:hypothetical protein
MYYHFAILLLFRQFWNLNIFESSTFPRTVCSEAAQNIFVLIRSFKDLYTLRRTPSFVPYIILTATLAYLADIKHEQTVNGMTSLTYGSQGLNLLLEMCTSHFFAKRAIEIIKFFAERWGLQVPELDAIPPRSQHSDDEDEDYHPLAFPQAFTFFRPDTALESQEPQSPRLSTLPTLFSPFPAQGQAGSSYVGISNQILDEGQRRHLRQCGFDCGTASLLPCYQTRTRNVNTGPQVRLERVVPAKIAAAIVAHYRLAASLEAAISFELEQI